MWLPILTNATQISVSDHSHWRKDSTIDDALLAGTSGLWYTLVWLCCVEEHLPCSKTWSKSLNSATALIEGTYVSCAKINMAEVDMP